VKCEECESEAAEVTGLTEDARTEIRCTACGFHWIHGPSPAEKKAGRSGGTKHHCPVCVAIFSDPTAPIVTIGTPSKSGHRCDRTKSFRLGARYGASDEALDNRLVELNDQALADWPRVLEMKRERLGH
jgi:DNA-directed RNA polymerase subunit RPC12/RpoP